MLLKDLRLSARYGKAHGLVLKERYLEAFKLIRSIIEVDQNHYLVPLLHEDLGICLYHLGEYTESYEIMTKLADRLLTESVKGEFELDLESLERVTWYIRGNEKAMGKT